MCGNAVIPGALKSANPIHFSKDRPWHWIPDRSSAASGMTIAVICSAAYLGRRSLPMPLLTNRSV